jgi:hypothetical protein
MAVTTIDRVVGKGDVGGGVLGIRINDSGKLAVPVVAVGFDLSLRIGGGGRAAGEVVGVVVLDAVGVGLAQKASADVVVPVGVIPLGIVEVLQCSAIAPDEPGDAVKRIDGGHALTEGIVAEEVPAVLPILVVGEVEDFGAVAAGIGHGVHYDEAMELIVGACTKPDSACSKPDTACSKPDFGSGRRQMSGNQACGGEAAATFAGYGSAGEQPER